MVYGEIAYPSAPVSGPDKIRIEEAVLHWIACRSGLTSREEVQYWLGFHQIDGGAGCKLVILAESALWEGAETSPAGSLEALRRTLTKLRRA